MSLVVVVNGWLTFDAPAQLRLQLRWLGLDARGQLFPGECLQRALRQLQALDVSNEEVNMMMFLGMFDADCRCDWCTD